MTRRWRASLIVLALAAFSAIVGIAITLHDGRRVCGAAGAMRRAVRFTDIRVGIDLDSDATAEQVATLERLTHRYCVIYQSLAQPPTLGLSVTSAAIGS